MSEKTIVITETEGKYRMQNNGISEFALIGILECILFDLKSAGRQEPSIEKPKVTDDLKQRAPETTEKVPEAGMPDLRTRIGNAVKAVKDLGGEAEHTDLTKLTNEELQAELEELTNQYKRLKGSKSPKK